MEINELIKIGVDRIKGRLYSNPVLEATLLLSKLMKVDKVYIYTHGKDEVPEEIVEEYMKVGDGLEGGFIEDISSQRRQRRPWFVNRAQFTMAFSFLRDVLCSLLCSIVRHQRLTITWRRATIRQPLSAGLKRYTVAPRFGGPSSRQVHDHEMPPW